MEYISKCIRMFICCHKVIGWLDISMTSLQLYTFAHVTGQSLRPKTNYQYDTVRLEYTCTKVIKNRKILTSKVKFLYQNLCDFLFFRCTI